MCPRPPLRRQQEGRSLEGRDTGFPTPSPSVPGSQRAKDPEVCSEHIRPQGSRAGQGRVMSGPGGPPSPQVNRRLLDPSRRASWLLLTPGAPHAEASRLPSLHMCVCVCVSDE